MTRLGYQKPDPVYALLNGGHLIGHRIATRAGGKPRWKVFEHDLGAFLEGTRNGAPVPAPNPPARRRGTAKRYIDRTRRI